MATECILRLVVHFRTVPPEAQSDRAESRPTRELPDAYDFPVVKDVALYRKFADETGILKIVMPAF